jgi:hypothetical protein
MNSCEFARTNKIDVHSTTLLFVISKQQKQNKKCINIIQCHSSKEKPPAETEDDDRQ